MNILELEKISIEEAKKEMSTWNEYEATIMKAKVAGASSGLDDWTILVEYNKLCEKAGFPQFCVDEYLCH